jgi:hypothetical protein
MSANIGKIKELQKEIERKEVFCVLIVIFQLVALAQPRTPPLITKSEHSIIANFSRKYYEILVYYHNFLGQADKRV